MIAAAGAALVAAQALTGGGSPEVFALAAGQARSHAIVVPPGHVQTVLVAPRFGSLQVRLAAPEAPPREIPLPDEDWLVPLVLAAGENALEIAAPAAVSYELRAEPPAPERERDRRRLEAQAAWIEGVGLAAAATVESRGEARDRLSRAAALFEEARDTRGLAAARQAEAWTLAAQADVPGAVAAYRAAASGWQEAGEARAEAAALARLSYRLLFIGGYENAEREAARSAGLWHALGDGRGEGRALYLRSLVLFSLGRYEEVQASGAEAAPLLEANGEWHLLGEATNLLARAQAVMGNVDEALNLHLRALDAFRARDDLLGQAQTETYLARLQSALGESESALSHGTRALSLARRAGNVHWEAFARMTMSQSARALGRFDLALDSAQAALAIWRGVKVQWSQAWAQAEIGAIHAARGQHRRALEVFDSAVAVHRSLADDQRLAQTLEYAGRSWLALGEPARALPLLEEARGVWRRLGNGWNEVTVVAALALARFDTGEVAAARSLLDEAIARVEALRGGIPGDVPRAAYLASVRSVYDLQMRTLWRLHQASPAAGFDAQALALSERARARSLLDLLAEKRMDVRKGISPELKRREREVHARLARIQHEMAAAQSRPKGAERAARLQAELLEADREREALERDVRRLHPRYAGLGFGQPVRPEQLRALLDADSALLEYAVGREQSHLFVLTRERQAWYPLPGARRIEAPLRRLRLFLERPTSLRAAYLRDARDLYRLLVAPAEADLQGKRHLVVVPDGALHQLPFDALLTNGSLPGGYAGLPYLARKWSVSVAPSGSVLLELLREPAHAQAAGAPTLVAFGDPALERAKGNAPPPLDAYAQRSGAVETAILAPLPGARDEVRRIGGLFPASTVSLRLGADASERAVKTEPAVGTTRFLHFATHAIVSAEEPQFSGLVLARDAGGVEDGVLQVYEIFNLELSCDMVVLSACRTGLGRSLAGEGIVGLSRAFLHAGARSLVTSLWPVNDASTAELMMAFYERLAATDRAGSLREAKLALIGSRRFAHPHHWSAFVLQGAPR